MALLTGSANCIKYTLFAFNLVFLITGIILIAVGVAVAAIFNEYELFLTDNFFSIPTFLIVIGAFIFVISFVGCWGAIKEQYCLILIFSVLLGIIFILELAAGISGYVLRNDAGGLINGRLQETLKNYNKDGYDATTTLWDFVQREFVCCGVENYTDWNQVTNNDYLPLSCCNIPDGVIEPFSCTTNIEDKNRHSNGCLSGFTNFISSHAVSLGAAGVVIAVLQFFGVIFACYIAREVKIRNGITGFM